MSESRVSWAISVPILVFLGLSVLDLGPMYATDIRQTSDTRQTASSLNAPTYYGRGHNKQKAIGRSVVRPHTRGVRVEHFSYPTRPVPDDAYPYPYPTRAENSDESIFCCGEHVLHASSS